MTTTDGRTVRVAMIGAGRMANTVHYPSLASFDDVKIAAICDVDQERLAQTADKYGVEGRYSDFKRMVEETAPDAVYAIGPPHVMYDVWTWCLSQGLNLFIEKPMGITMHQARMLAHLAESKGCVTQVDFQRRTHPLFSALRNECLKHGPVTQAVCRFHKFNLNPSLKAMDHTLDDAIHAIDTVRWMCGGEVARVHSSAKRVQVPDINCITALIEFDSGATGVVMTSWSSGRRNFSIELHTPGACAETDGEETGRLFIRGDDAGMSFDNRELAGSDRFFIAGGFRAKNREFIDAVKSGTRPGSHFGDAVKSMELAQRILAQALFD